MAKNNKNETANGDTITVTVTVPLDGRSKEAVTADVKRAVEQNLNQVKREKELQKMFKEMERLQNETTTSVEVQEV